MVHIDNPIVIDHPVVLGLKDHHSDMILTHQVTIQMEVLLMVDDRQLRVVHLHMLLVYNVLLNHQLGINHEYLHQKQQMEIRMDILLNHRNRYQDIRKLVSDI
jgi:hypothetical protein